MSSLAPFSTQSSRSTTTTHPSSLPSGSHPSPFPTTPYADEWDDDEEEHDQDSDDEFLLGFSARTIALESSQNTEDDYELPTPPSSLPDTAQLPVDDFHEDTFLDSYPPSPHPDLAPKSFAANPQHNAPSQLPTPSLPLSNSPGIAELADDEDDGAFLARLMKQQEGMRTAQLTPALPQPSPVEPLPDPLPPDVVRGDDPLELYYHSHDNDSDVEMEDGSTG